MLLFKIFQTSAVLLFSHGSYIRRCTIRKAISFKILQAAPSSTRLHVFYRNLYKNLHFFDNNRIFFYVKVLMQIHAISPLKMCSFMDSFKIKISKRANSVDYE